MCNLIPLLIGRTFKGISFGRRKKAIYVTDLSPMKMCPFVNRCFVQCLYEPILNNNICYTSEGIQVKNYSINTIENILLGSDIFERESNTSRASKADSEKNVKASIFQLTKKLINVTRLFR